MGRERTGKVEEGRERGMMTGEREEEREGKSSLCFFSIFFDLCRLILTHTLLFD